MVDDAAPNDEWNPSRPAARRSLILCGIGAVIGLLIAGFGLFTAQGTRTGTVPAEDVAVVNQVPLLMADYVQQLRALYSVDLGQATVAQKKQVLDDMIREELYVQRGIELGMPTDDIDVRAALVTATEAQTASDATTAGATESELHGYFDSHAASYASEGVMRLDDWLVPTGKDAPAIVAALRRGQSPASLGLVSSGKVDDGEEFYFAARIHLGPALFAAARRLGDGQVSAPLLDGGRTHILVMRHDEPPVVARFDEVRDRVLADYVKLKAARLEQGNDRFLRRRADIKIAAGFQ